MSPRVPLFLAICLIAGCNQPTEPAAEPSSVATASGAIRFEPATLPCTASPGSKVLVTWDTSPAKGIVDVSTVGPNGRETLFATGGPRGSKETGPWMRPGSTFVVRNHASGAELGRAAISSAACGR